MGNAFRTITVVSQKAITSGEGSHGEWTLSAVEACDEHGQPIIEQLRTFEDLPQGEPIEVEVELRPSEKYGPSYTLKLPRD